MKTTQVHGPAVLKHPPLSPWHERGETLGIVRAKTLLDQLARVGVIVRHQTCRPAKSGLATPIGGDGYAGTRPNGVVGSTCSAGGTGHLTIKFSLGLPLYLGVQRSAVHLDELPRDGESEPRPPCCRLLELAALPNPSKTSGGGFEGPDIAVATRALRDGVNSTSCGSNDDGSGECDLVAVKSPIADRRSEIADRGSSRLWTRASGLWSIFQTCRSPALVPT